MRSIFSIVLLFSFSTANAYTIVLKKEKYKKYVTKEFLRKVYLGYEKFWEDEQRISSVISKIDSDDVRNFLDQVCAHDPGSFKSYWRRKLFSGNGTPPKEFEDDDKVIEFIKKNPSSIGVISNYEGKDEEVVVVPNTSISLLLY